MTTAFVTGATGFLGRHLCALLRTRGIRVHEHRRALGDLRDAAATRQAVQSAQPDWIFHLAADTRHTAPLTELLQTTVVGTLNVLNAAEGRPVIAVGSYEEYGDCPAPFREDMAPRPRTAYGVSKAAATLLVTAAPAAVIRLPVVYGPGQSTATFIGGACAALRTGQRFAMTPGEQTRDFLFVADAVEALVIAAEKFAVSRGEVFNAGTGVPLTLQAAVRKMGKDFFDLGAKPYRSNEQMRYDGDCEKISRVLGWQAQTSFAQGIRQTLASDTQ